MSNQDKYFNNKLEIDEIFKRLATYAILEDTINYIQELPEIKEKRKIEEELNKVNEARNICLRYERCPIYLTLPYGRLLDKACKDGILSGKELYETLLLFTSIRASNRLLDTLTKDNFACSQYKEKVNELVIIEYLENKLRSSISEDGYILDDATKELKKIRNRLKGIDERIKSKLQEIISQKSKILADNVVVIRNDRYCLAVKSEYKNSFDGILQDVSSSNMTSYMEPSAVASLSNEKDTLRNLEKEEMEKILRMLSNSIKGEVTILERNYEIFKELDLTFSKALLAISYDGTAPRINDKGILSLKNARHPLLKVEKVIPNNVSFGRDTLGIVITGPNTGGKTVLLKTIGLLSLMIKYGLLIPADEDSDIMIYDHILCDIGDDQSIYDNLSTFSSHMKKMVGIVNLVTPKSLALFDEIGAGTDPLEGSSIAIAVLEYFLKNNISFVTTTHYAELKTFAYTTKGVVNASMEFNNDTQMPTYRLVVGKSGSSNAFNIAKRLGLKKEIIDEAVTFMNKSSSSVLDTIKLMEEKSLEISNLEKELTIEKKKLEEKENEYNNKLKEIDTKKDQIYNDASKRAEQKISKVVLEAQTILEEAKKVSTKDSKLHEIIAAKHNLDSFTEKPMFEKRKKKKIQQTKKLEVGDRVFLPNYEQYGNITRIRKNGTYDIAFGNMNVNLTRNDIEYTTDKPVEESNFSYVSGGESRKAVKLSLDLRGARYTDALDLIDKYIDELVVNNIKQATIIHGFGTGTIRELVQDYCRKSKYIKEFHYGGEGEGGFGVTVITLK